MLDITISFSMTIKLTCQDFNHHLLLNVHTQNHKIEKYQ